MISSVAKAMEDGADCSSRAVGNRYFSEAMARVPERFREVTISEWSPTPFMTDVNVAEKEEEIMRWLHLRFGRESSPMHGREGVWRRSFVTIHGRSWFGFSTPEFLSEFRAIFPA